MKLPEGIQRELDAAEARDGKTCKLFLARIVIEDLLHMGPHRAELYMAKKYEEME